MTIFIITLHILVVTIVHVSVIPFVIFYGCHDDAFFAAVMITHLSVVL